MIISGDRIVAGVSGGADSLCLLFLLLEYAKRVPLSLAVAHIDHGIRPDAGEDARYVEEVCRREGLSFFLTRGDVTGMAKKERLSVEDAGRRIRYEAFHRAAESMGGAKIAVAHNRNDNAETMLFHLFRGSGLKGLCGITPVRGDIIRPVLCLERREVEAYLGERGIAWRNDSTNEEDDYSRNRIRHHILSYAEEEIFAGTVEHMGRTAEMLEETEDYLARQTEEALEKCLVLPKKEIRCFDAAAAGGGESDGKGWGDTAETGIRGEMCFGKDPDSGSGGDGMALSAEVFREFHPVLQKRMLHTLIKQLSPTGKDIRQVHVRDVMSLFTQEGNRSISLPFGIIAEKRYDIVVLERKNAVWRNQPITVPFREEIPGHSLVYDLGNMGKIEFSVFLGKKWEEVPKNQYTKWFDYDKIEESLVIRSRCTGDYLTIRDGKGNMVHKSLKDYMVTEKIPRQLRDRIPVVAAGKHVLWLTGWRISEHFKVSGSTKRILQIRLLPKESGGSCKDSETEEKNVRTHQSAFTGGGSERKGSGDRGADQQRL